MYRQRIALAIAAVFCVAAIVGTAKAQDAEDQIENLEKARAAAVVKGDVATLEEQTSDDYTFINANGKMNDKSQALGSIKSGETKLTAYDLSDLKVRIYGDTAVITGKADIKGTTGGQPAPGSILFTRVYVKKGGRWQSVAFQQTKSAP